MPSADPTKREISMALTKEITEKKTTLKSLRSVEVGAGSCSPLRMAGHQSASSLLTYGLADLAAQPLPVEDNLVNLGAIMEATGLADMSDVSADLQAEAARIGGIAQDCVTGIVESRGQLEAIWDNDKMLEYELSSVFMHRGENTLSGTLDGQGQTDQTFVIQVKRATVITGCINEISPRIVRLTPTLNSTIACP